MSAIANVAIVDGKATPLTHTFKPVKSGGEISTWRTADSSLPLVGQEQVDLKLSRAPKAAVNVWTLVLNLPALETATGANASGYTAAPKVAYSHRVKIEFFCPERGLPAQRTDLRKLLINLLSDPQIVDAIDNQSPPY